MAARLTLPRTAAWVWHGEPRSIFGLDAVFVRCASGTSGTAPSGFSYADNFRAWLRARGPSVIPWSWFGPYGVVIVKAVTLPRVVAARAVATNRSRGPLGSA